MTNAIQQLDDDSRQSMSVALEGRFFIDAVEGPIDCIVRDISASGAQVQVDQEFIDCTPAVICIEGFGRFDCITTPRSSDLIPLRFIMGSEQARSYREALSEYQNTGRKMPTRLRRSSRKKTEDKITFRRKNRETARCEVVNISEQGVLLKTDIQIPVGEIIELAGRYGRVVRQELNGIAVFMLAPVNTPA